MTIYPSLYRGTLTLREDARLTGSVQGDVHLTGPITVELCGIVSGDVRIEAATLLLTGMVKGSVHNRGGTVRMTGLVGGVIHELQPV